VSKANVATRTADVVGTFVERGLVGLGLIREIDDLVVAAISSSTRDAEIAPAGLGRRRRPCGQLNDFVCWKAKALLAGVIVARGLGRAVPLTSRTERKIAGAILACWSLVHGLTLLLADGLVGPKKKSGALADRLLQGMLDGLAVDLPALPPGTWVGPQGPTA
jgi:hypothetical protein